MAKTDLELIAYPRILIKSWKMIGLGMVICAAAAALITLFLPDQYEAAAKLIAVEPRFQSEVAYSKQPFTLKRFFPLLEDKSLLKETITELGLDTPPGSMTVKGLSKMVKADLEEQSEIIEINVVTPSPELSARIANSLAAGFQRKLKNVVVAGGLDSKSFLKERLNDTRQKLHQAEDAYGAFLQSAHLQELRSRLTSYLYIAEINGQDLAQTRLQLSRTEGELRKAEKLIKEGIKLPSFSTPAAQMEIELAGWREQEKALKEMRRENLAEAQRIQKELARKEVEAGRLERAVNMREEVTREMAKSYEESILAIYQQVGEVQIISRAFAPGDKSGPSLELNILLGLLAGMFVSTITVFYREYLQA